MDKERRRSPAEARRFWELAIDLWSNSGLSVADFCWGEGLKKSSFYGWQRRLRKERSPSDTVTAEVPTSMEPEPAQAVRESTGRKLVRRRKHSRQFQGSGSLVPVCVVDDATPPTAGAVSTPRPSAPIEIVLPHGTRIHVEHGCDQELLHRVLAALENRPC